MNPFEDYTNNSTTNTTARSINIWVTQNGRKHNTYVSGWDIEDELIKEHHKTMKKFKGCNGSIKNMEVDGGSVERVIQLQGDHADYIKKFISDTGIDASLIYIKG
jgi:translation initiation factor 1 (eIF-1/SUI1)